MHLALLIATTALALGGQGSSQAQPVPTAEVQAVQLPRTEQRVIRSTRVDETYLLQIYLPPGYENAATGPFPVLYLLDGDRSFGMAVDVVGWLIWAGEIPWKEFRSILEASLPKGLEWTAETLPGESHISAWPVAFTRGLKVLFPPTTVAQAPRARQPTEPR